MRSLTAALVVCLAAALAAQTPRELFERARMLEESNNKLTDAIALYAQVASQSTDRHLAATAQLRIGLIHERLGQKADAQRAFRKVVASFADQPDLASQAQARLGDASPAGPNRAMTLRRIWTGPDVDVLGSVSKDGRYLSFANWTTGDLGVRDVATGEHRLLTVNDAGRNYTTYAEESTISPDGKYVAYSWYTGNARYDLRIVPLHGRAEPRVLYASDGAMWIGAFDWSPDGRFILVHVARAPHLDQIGLVSTADGSLRVLKSVRAMEAGRPFFSPDGRHIAYDAVGRDSQRDVFILAVDGSRETVAVAHPARDTFLGWAPDGRHVLFGSDRTGDIGLWSIAVADGRAVGEPQLIRTDLGRGGSLGITHAGALFFGAWPGGVDVHVASVDFDTGAVLEAPVNPAAAFIGYNWAPRWSPDGRQLAYVSRRSPRPNGPAVIVLQSADARDVRELRVDLNQVSYAPPIWAPDGRALSVEGTDRAGQRGIFAVDVRTAATTPLKTAALLEALANGGWSSAGDRIFFRRTTLGDDATPAFVQRDLASGAERVVIERRPLGALCLSPDGRFIATPGRSDDGRTTLLLIPAGGGEPTELFHVPQTDRLTYPAWTPDSRIVLVRRESTAGGGAETDGYWRVPIDGGAPRPLKWALKPSSANRWISIHPDGRRVAYTSGAQRFEVWMMENILPPPRTPSSASRAPRR